MYLLSNPSTRGEKILPGPEVPVEKNVNKIKLIMQFLGARIIFNLALGPFHLYAYQPHNSS